MASGKLADSTAAAPPPPADTDPRYAQLFADSPLKSEPAKEMLAKTAVVLMRRIAALQALADEGKLTGEETRALPALASNLRRTLIDLRVTERTTEDDEDGTEGGGLL